MSERNAGRDDADLLDDEYEDPSDPDGEEIDGSDPDDGLDDDDEIPREGQDAGEVEDDEDLDDDADDLEGDEPLPGEGDESTRPRLNAAGRKVDPATGKFVPGRVDPMAPGEPAPGDGTPGAGEEPDPYEGALRFRSDREEFVVEGSYQDDHWAYIPRETAEELLRLAGRGKHHEQTYPRERESWGRERTDLSRRVAEAESRAAAAEAAERTVTEHMADLVRGPNGGAVAVQKWLQDLDRNWDLLQAKAENAKLQAQVEGRAKIEEAGQGERRAQEYEEYVQLGLEREIYAALEHPEIAPLVQYLDEEDLIDLYRTLYATKDAIFWVARADNDRGSGARKGQVVTDRLPVRQALKTLASAKARAAGAAGAGAGQGNGGGGKGGAASAAAARNQRRGGIVTPPPRRQAPNRMPGGRGGLEGGEAPRKRIRPPKNQQEADRLLSLPVDVANERIRRMRHRR